MITLPSHTSNALQPLVVAYFKPFKIAFRKERNITMVRRNYTEPHKIALVRWVDKTLNLAQTKKNIMSWFKGIGTWPLNPNNSKIDPNIMYTLQNQAME